MLISATNSDRGGIGRKDAAGKGGPTGVNERVLGGDQPGGDRGRVLQRGTSDLGRVDHAGGDEVVLHVGLSVEAEHRVVPLKQLARDHRAPR